MAIIKKTAMNVIMLEVHSSLQWYYLTWFVEGSCVLVKNRGYLDVQYLKGKLILSFVEKWAEVETSILRESGKYVFSHYVDVRANRAKH